MREYRPPWELDPNISLYKILQVDPESEFDIIQVAYRKLASKYHPDRDPSPEAARRMLAINRAWDVLQDPERRRAYDAEWRARRNRRSGDRVVQQTGYGAAGAAKGPPSGSVLDFGRYGGWSIGQIAREDPDFLEWLSRTPVGRAYTNEIEQVLRQLGRRR